MESKFVKLWEQRATTQEVIEERVTPLADAVRVVARQALARVAKPLAMRLMSRARRLGLRPNVKEIAAKYSFAAKVWLTPH
jgi:hypothetical protein